MKILCLKITFLLLLLFEMPFWISMLHPSGTRPIPSISTAFYLNHDIPGLTYDHSMELSYAEEFSVDYYNDGYALITIDQEG